MTPNPKIQELIKSMGIIPESEHYEIAERVVRECADLVRDDDNAFDILKHFGVEG